jgi:uncharacterized repeat protein (TIGR01451 family)
LKKIIILILILLGNQFAKAQLWEQTSTFPGILRHSSGSFTLNNSGFIVGGYGINNQVLSDVWKYDAYNDSWTQLNDIPVAVFGASFFVINDTAYMTNGWMNAAGNPNDSLYRYEELTDTWTSISVYPGTPAYTCATFVLNNKAYIGIGYSPYTKELWEYDPLTNSWTAKANFIGTNRQNGTSFVLNNIAYYGLGATSSSAKSDIFSFDPIADTWTLVGNFPGGPRYATTTFTINNKAYIGCGSDISNFYNDFWEYDPSILTWTQLDDFAGTERHATNHFVINGIGYSGLGRSATFQPGFWKFIPAGLNEIRGFAYRDQNQNSIYDTLDIPEQQLLVEVNPGGKVYTSNSIGYIKVPADTLVTYTMNVLNLPNNYSLSGTNNPISFSTSGNIDSSTSFILTPTSTVNDVSVHLTSITPMRAGFDGYYSITYKNEGTTVVDSVLIKLNMIAQLDYFSTNPIDTPVYISSNLDTVHWQQYNLIPGETRSFMVRFENAFWGNLGDSVVATAEIYSGLSEIDTVNNFSTYIDTLVGSYDPNDKAVSSAKLTPSEVAAEKWLTYKIRFQNTGTFQANYVRITDTIPAELNLASFDLLAYSHQPCTYTLEGNRVIKFDFPGIILADSNSNEPESHGFIEFRIKPNTNLVLGNVISNRVYIYFDFNPPVITNDAITTVENATSVLENNATENNVRIFPNPSSEFITCKVISNSKIDQLYQINIFDVLGKVVSTENNLNLSNPINIKSLKNGLYLLQLVDANGNTYSETFIKN